MPVSTSRILSSQTSSMPRQAGRDLRLSERQQEELTVCEWCFPYDSEMPHNKPTRQTQRSTSPHAEGAGLLCVLCLFRVHEGNREPSKCRMNLLRDIVSLPGRTTDCCCLGHISDRNWTKVSRSGILERGKWPLISSVEPQKGVHVALSGLGLTESL